VFDCDTALMPEVLTVASLSFGARGRAYGVCATALEAGWLAALGGGTPLVRYGPPLASPPPRYDPRADAVRAAATPFFGDRAWKLPTAWVEHPTAGREERAAVVALFARALLEGAVVPSLARWRGALAASPALLTKPGAQLRHTRRAGDLLHALESPRAHVPARVAEGAGAALAAALAAPVATAAALRTLWAHAPGFLAAEVRAWLAEDAGAELLAAWPALVREFLAAGAAPRAAEG
jgi:hypothetical protein